MTDPENKPSRNPGWVNPREEEAYAYRGRHSKQAWPPLVTGIAVCLLLTGFGIWRWFELRHWEQTGGYQRLYVMEWLLYKLGGEWAVLVMMVLLGIMGLLAGIRSWKRRRLLLNRRT
jgi:hypothetical protein